MSKTSIEWTRDDDGSGGETWNPVTGCTEVSPGCDHCYAKTFAERWRGVSGHPYEQGFDLKLWPERLELPLRWRKPRRIFVNSMSDLFHGGVRDEFIARVFAIMAEAPQHTFQCLTKRPGRMCSLLNSLEFRHLVMRAMDGLAVEQAHDARERWAPIPGFDGYEASSHGRIRSGPTVLATTVNPATGRETVTLWNHGKPKTKTVHRLVLLAHEPQGDLFGEEVCHRNGDKRDNRLANLRWGTRSENQREKVRHGSRGGPQRLAPQEVATIKAARRAGRTQQSVADEFGVSRSLVSLIENGHVWSEPGLPWPLPNVWLGVSVESQKWADMRIPKLLDTPAAIRFLSCEPLLGPVDLSPWLHDSNCVIREEGVCICAEPREAHVDWVIAGGESGPGARPMHPQWARDLRDQCRAGGVAYFFKQWGRWRPIDDQSEMPSRIGCPVFDLSGAEVDFRRLGADWWPGFDAARERGWQMFHAAGKHAAGRELDGREWSEYPR